MRACIILSLKQKAGIAARRIRADPSARLNLDLIFDQVYAEDGSGQSDLLSDHVRQLDLIPVNIHTAGVFQDQGLILVRN